MKLEFIIIKQFYKENWKNKAMAIIWENFYNKLFYYIKYNFNINENVEDIIQEIMMKIFNNLDNFKQGKSFNSYIYSITRNHCIDYLRLNKIADDIDDFIVEDKKEQLENNYLQKEINEQIEIILNKFNSENKEIAYLRFFENFSYKKISEITGFSLQNIKNRVFQIKKKLSMLK